MCSEHSIVHNLELIFVSFVFELYIIGPFKIQKPTVYSLIISSKHPINCMIGSLQYNTE